MAKDTHESGSLFVLTRVTNQLGICCRELRLINAHSGIRATATVLKNKMDMCPVGLDESKVQRALVEESG